MGPRIDFDTAYYMEVNQAREMVFDLFVPGLVKELDLQTGVDLGSGIGYYAAYLTKLGLKVTAFDAREDNIKIARTRYPDIQFWVGDIENLPQLEVKSYDLVFCAGLLYHLENPFRAVRNVRKLCDKVCVLESRVHRSHSPDMIFVRDGEGLSQAINQYAFVPSRRCLIEMLYISGFEYVYSVKFSSKHEELACARFKQARRHFLVSSKIQISDINLELEPRNAPEDYCADTIYRKSRRRFLRSVLDSIHWLL